MNEIEVNESLRGRTVRNAACPQWGEGKVVRVVPAGQGGALAWRVTVDFSIAGRKTVVCPPARLVEPTREPEREQGWLDTLAGNTLDDRLTQIPERILTSLAPPRERMRLAAPLFAFNDEPKSLITWARGQLGIADPLSRWSRDELAVAFGKFCLERDSWLRNQAALLAQREGRDALHAFLETFPERERTAMRAALARVL